VLYFILDTSLFNKIVTNRAKSVILFYTEVFFSQPSFLAAPTFELYRKLLSFVLGAATPVQKVYHWGDAEDKIETVNLI